MPAPLAAYLRRATFGLPPERREEVWNELEEHILCRVEGLEFQGLPPDQALATALREMGPPLRVSAAMNGVHNMPKLIAFVTLMTFAASVGLYALAQKPETTMQVNVKTHVSAFKCLKKGEPQPELRFLFATSSGFTCYQNDAVVTNGTFVTINEIAKSLEPLGITTKVLPDVGKIEFFYKPLGGRLVAETYIVYKDAQDSYVDVGDLFGVVINGFPIPTHIENFAQPEVIVGNKALFKLANSNVEVGQQVYQTLAKQIAYKLFDFSTQGRYFSYQFSDPLPSSTAQKVQTDLPEGEVVAAFQYLSATPQYDADTGKRYLNTISSEIGVVDAEGKVQFRLPGQGAKFVATAPIEPEAHTVMLVHLSNTPFQNIKSGIFLPKE